VVCFQTHISGEEITCGAVLLAVPASVLASGTTTTAKGHQPAPRIKLHPALPEWKAAALAQLAKAGRRETRVVVPLPAASIRPDASNGTTHPPPPPLPAAPVIGLIPAPVGGGGSGDTPTAAAALRVAVLAAVVPRDSSSSSSSRDSAGVGTANLGPQGGVTADDVGTPANPPDSTAAPPQPQPAHLVCVTAPVSQVRDCLLVVGNVVVVAVIVRLAFHRTPKGSEPGVYKNGDL
jgi:hypothetical protein